MNKLVPQGATRACGRRPNFDLLSQWNRLCAGHLLGCCGTEFDGGFKYGAIQVAGKIAHQQWR